MEAPLVASTSSRILYDVPCAVCRDHSSGKHYGVFACDGCAGFFKRSVRRGRQYACKSRVPGVCLVDKAHRNQCRACRLAKCLDVGMNRDAVQHERGPRNSTIRRQMAMFYKDPPTSSSNDRPLPPEIELMKQNLMPQLPNYVFPTEYYTRLKFPPPPIVVDSRNSVSSFRPGPMFLPTEADALCESGARILFMNVTWAKSVPAFNSLSLSDRLVLLVESWRDLFVLATAQFLFPANLRVLYKTTMGAEVLSGMQLFERALSEIALVRPDSNEFSCLRGLMVFKTTLEGQAAEAGGPSAPDAESRRLHDVAAVAALQDHARSILREYATHRYPLEHGRVSQLYQLLDAVRLVPGEAIVSLFFKNTIGEIPIEKIICDMYRSENST